jgi:hypothetical protein
MKKKSPTKSFLEIPVHVADDILGNPNDIFKPIILSKKSNRSER